MDNTILPMKSGHNKDAKNGIDERNLPFIIIHYSYFIKVIHMLIPLDA